ncbi:TetR/AcrR family transcriptional regulator [Amycolatopsis sp. 195334CR]|uniref:TetR/AcrR family transcriptional regulator n=1 Tax=Amycolatopsis sp. 195334CR TaxID=2814588 RepID=UPI001A8C4CFD|nr:TetR/AcrR family transcriptional regulator [Amycolatopsis sp. 195334CR]MBN6038168.1 TetR/AcrR family transcriptional regulator [Amycolatopsis sp. 195334CR]
METTGKTSRERYRAQVRAEVKEQAWEQIATAGVTALSLNAIAKSLGMSGPALYRYFASRDELITELIRDAYRSLAEKLRAAFDAGADVSGLAYQVREWALADPHRYFLIYGTPVPGYHAPDDTTAISNEIMTVLLDAHAAAQVDPENPMGTTFERHLDQHRDWTGAHPASTSDVRRALAFWTRLHGVLSLELAGQFAGMGFDPALLFDDELDDLLRD